MIDFNKYPRTKELTYTIIERKYAGSLQRALKLAKETDWTTRTCKIHDKSMLEDIKEHLPEWFDARYYVLISHFESNYLLQHLNEIKNDKDIKAIFEQEKKIVQKDYLENHI